MRQPLLLILLGVATFFYFNQPPASSRLATAAPPSSPAVHPHANVAAEAVSAPVIAAASSYNDRWKTGPNAQTDLKTGPNAQTDFAPFAPSEQATWNQTSGYTIVSGPQMPRR